MPAWSYYILESRYIEAYIDLSICSNDPKGGMDCCNIHKLRKGEWSTSNYYTGFNKNELTKFTGRQLKNCDHFPLPSIDKFLVTYFGESYVWHTRRKRGYWGGEFIKISLNNRTTIKCDIYEKVGDEGAFHQDISKGCRESVTIRRDFSDGSSTSVHKFNRFHIGNFLSLITYFLLCQKLIDLVAHFISRTL